MSSHRPGSGKPRAANKDQIGFTFAKPNYKQPEPPSEDQPYANTPRVDPRSLKQREQELGRLAFNQPNLGSRAPASSKGKQPAPSPARGILKSKGPLPNQAEQKPSIRPDDGNGSKETAGWHGGQEDGSGPPATQPAKVNQRWPDQRGMEGRRHSMSGSGTARPSVFRADGTIPSPDSDDEEEVSPFERLVDRPATSQGHHHNYAQGQEDIVNAAGRHHTPVDRPAVQPNRNGNDNANLPIRHADRSGPPPPQPHRAASRAGPARSQTPAGPRPAPAFRTGSVPPGAPQPFKPTPQGFGTQPTLKARPTPPHPQGQGHLIRSPNHLPGAERQQPPVETADNDTDTDMDPALETRRQMRNMQHRPPSRAQTQPQSHPRPPARAQAARQADDLVITDVVGQPRRLNAAPSLGHHPKAPMSAPARPATAQPEHQVQQQQRQFHQSHPVLRSMSSARPPVTPTPTATLGSQHAALGGSESDVFNESGRGRQIARPTSVASNRYDDEESKSAKLVQSAIAALEEQKDKRRQIEDLITIKSELEDKLAGSQAELRSTLSDLAKAKDEAEQSEKRRTAAISRTLQWSHEYKVKHAEIAIQEACLRKSAEEEAKKLASALKAANGSQLEGIRDLLDAAKDEHGGFKGFAAAKALLDQEGEMKKTLREAGKEIDRFTAVEKDALARLQKAEKENDRLNKEVETRRKELQSLNDDFNAARQAVEEADAEMKEAAASQKERDALQARLDRQTAKVTELQASLTQRDMDDEERKEYVKACTEMLQSLGVKVDELDGSLDDAEAATTEKLQALQANLDKANKIWGQRLRAAADDSNQKSTEIKDLKAKIEASKAKLLTAENDLKISQDATITAQQEIARLQGVETALKTEKEGLEKQVALVKDVEDRTAGEKHADQKITELNKLLATARQDHKQLKETVAQKEKDAVKLKKQIKDAEEKVQRLEGLVKTLEENTPAEDVTQAEKINDLQLQIGAMQQEQQSAQAKLKETQKKLDQLQLDKQVVDQCLRDALQKAGEANTSDPAAQAELDKLRTALETATAEKAEMSAANNKVVADLRAQIPQGSMRDRYKAGTLTADEKDISAFFNDLAKSNADSSLADIRNSLKRTTHERDELKKKLQTQVQMRNTAATASQADTSRAKTLEDQVAQLQKELTMANMRVASANQKAESRNKAFKDEVLKLKTADAEAEKKDKEIEELQKQVKALQAQAETAKGGSKPSGSRKRNKVVLSDEEDGEDGRALPSGVDDPAMVQAQIPSSGAATLPADPVTPASKSSAKVPSSSSSALTPLSGSSGVTPYKPLTIATAHSSGAASGQAKRPLKATVSNARIHGTGDPEKLNKQFKVPSKKVGTQMLGRTPSSRPRRIINYMEKPPAAYDDEEDDDMVEDIQQFSSQVDPEEVSFVRSKGKGKASDQASDKGKDQAVKIKGKDGQDGGTDIEVVDGNLEVSKPVKKTRFADLPPSSSGPSSPTKNLDPPTAAEIEMLKFMDFGEDSQDDIEPPATQVTPAATQVDPPQASQAIDPGIGNDSNDSIFNVPTSQGVLKIPSTQNPDRLGNRFAGAKAATNLKTPATTISSGSKTPRLTRSGSKIDSSTFGESDSPLSSQNSENLGDLGSQVPAAAVSSSQKVAGLKRPRAKTTKVPTGSQAGSSRGKMSKMAKAGKAGKAGDGAASQAGQEGGDGDEDDDGDGDDFAASQTGKPKRKKKKITVAL